MVDETGSERELRGFLEDEMLQMREREGRTGVAIIYFFSFFWDKFFLFLGLRKKNTTQSRTEQ